MAELIEAARRSIQPRLTSEEIDQLVDLLEKLAERADNMRCERRCDKTPQAMTHARFWLDPRGCADHNRRALFQTKTAGASYDAGK